MDYRHVRLARALDPRRFRLLAGEYSKTYVLARQDYGDIMDCLRTGRIWVTTGDLVTSLDLTARGQGRSAAGITAPATG